MRRLAAVTTVYRPRSHSHHIVGRFLQGFSFQGQMIRPPFEVVRMYVDQYPENDLARGLQKKFGFELTKTVAEALGGDKLDVDAVLLIGEHGDYPTNEYGQVLYPRYELFSQIAEVFEKSGRGVPVFNDKHLSYDHRLAKKMVETAEQLKFPLMAGSSLPVTWRRPEIEPELGTPMVEGLACYGGSVEPYFFHGLETLQCMLERRRGGETGVAQVECIQGPAVWQAGDAGRWSWKLLNAALAHSPSRTIGDVRDNVTNPIAILIEYRDGTRGAVLNLADHITDFNFAAQVAGQDEPLAACFYLPDPPGAKYFDALTLNILKLYETGQAPYPIQRTLLTSTVLDFAMHSLHDGTPVKSPALDIRYQAPKDSGFVRGRFTDAPWE